jgi:hypothetical protein
MAVACVGLISAGGCADRVAEQENPAAVSVRAQDTQTGVTAMVAIDRAEIRTVDRLRVELRVSRPAGLPVEQIVPDFASAGWTIVDRGRPAWSTTEGGAIEELTVITLEPFLEGTYAVPGFEVSWGGDGDRRSVRTPSLDVSVGSVLGAADDGTLASVLPPVPPAEPASAVRSALVIAAVMVSLAAMVVLWRMTRPPETEHAEDGAPLDELRRAAAGRLDDGKALPRVHRAIDRLAGSDRSAGVRATLGTLRDRCERLRFGGGGAGPSEASEIARMALEAVEGGS